MAERQNPLHRLLRIPAVYDVVQRAFRFEGIQKTLLAKIGARPGDRVLDIGCGLGTILAELPAGVAYTGYEPNPKYVEQARATYGERGRFEVGLFDAKAAATIEPVDIVLVLAVLHHMSDSEAEQLFGLLAGVLKPGGRIVTLDNAFVPGQNPIARLLISLDRGRNVRAPEGYAALAGLHFSDVRGDVHHIAMPPYTYWIMTAAGPRQTLG